MAQIYLNKEMKLRLEKILKNGKYKGISHFVQQKILEEEEHKKDLEMELQDQIKIKKLEEEKIGAEINDLKNKLIRLEIRKQEEKKNNQQDIEDYKIMALNHYYVDEGEAYRLAYNFVNNNIKGNFTNYLKEKNVRMKIREKVGGFNASS